MIRPRHPPDDSVSYWGTLNKRTILPHKVSHRGAAPGDEELFGADALPVLRQATSDLCWLLNRGYAHASSLELVGNRYSLRDRQRLAVGRCACADQSVQRRRDHRLAPESMRGKELWLDGYNVLMALEAALGGGVVLVGRDRCCRDVLGIHGSYHRVQETVPALQLIGGLTSDLKIGVCHWWLDKPVSNSGRLKTLILDIARGHDWPWQVDLAMNPDRILADSKEVVATADSAILDRCERWFNLVPFAILRGIPNANLLDLSLP